MPAPNGDYMNYTLLIEDDGIEQWIYTPANPVVAPNENEVQQSLNQQLGSLETELAGVEQRENRNETTAGGL